MPPPRLVTSRPLPWRPHSQTQPETHIHTRTHAKPHFPGIPPQHPRSSRRETHTHTHTDAHTHRGPMGAELRLPSGAVRTDRRTQAAGDTQTPSRTQAGGTEPRYTPFIQVWGLRGRTGRPATCQQAAQGRYRQTPPPSAAAALTQTHPPTASPDTQTHILTGQMAVTRETPGGRADPPRPTPPQLGAGGREGCGRRVAAAAAAAAWRSRAGGTRTLALFSHTHTHLGCD